MAATIVITGASSGIGYQTALTLAKTGAVVILLCRKSAQSTLALQKIKDQSGSATVHLFTADLSRQQDIREAAEKILQQFKSVDVLVNNAACVTSKFQLTVDGFEMQWAVNHLAPFLLTHLLLPAIKNSKQGRIINVTSRAHSLANTDFEDVFFREKYSGSKAYNQTKLANIMFTYRLAQQLQNTAVTVNSVFPGLVNTDIGLKHNTLLRQWFWRAIRLLGVSAQKGAETILHLVTSPEVATISGKYFGNLQEQKSSSLSYNTSLAQKLWTISAQHTGIE